MATGKDSKCLSDLKIAHADDASGLIVLRTVTSISEKNNPDLYHVLIQFQEELENRFSKKIHKHTGAKINFLSRNYQEFDV